MPRPILDVLSGPKSLMACPLHTPSKWLVWQVELLHFQVMFYLVSCSSSPFLLSFSTSSFSPLFFPSSLSLPTLFTSLHSPLLPFHFTPLLFPFPLSSFSSLQPSPHSLSSTDIGVFFCGPPVLSHNLHRYCNEYTTQNDATRARFFYNKENF